jgi:hypothetical protein
MTKAQVRAQFPALLATWRELPENAYIDEQKLHFGDFYSWLVVNHQEATRFRSRRGPSEDLEQWFDVATHQSWRN